MNPSHSVPGRIFFRLVGCILWLQILCQAAPIEVGDRKQLFIDQLVYWKGKPDVSALRGRTVRLRFQLTRAKLFGFQFTED